jgi:tRNA-splicing ligase RtcB
MDDARDRYGIELPARQLACAPAPPPRDSSTWRRRQPPRTSPSRTGTHWPTPCAMQSPACSIPRLPKRRAKSTTSPTTWPRSNAPRPRRARPSQRRNARVPRRLARDSRRLSRGRQPVFIPGSMGTANFVLAGQPRAMERSFGTTCHGLGRAISRPHARKHISGAELRPRARGPGHRRALPIEQRSGRGSAVRLRGGRACSRGRRASRTGAPDRAARPNRRGQRLAVSTQLAPPNPSPSCTSPEPRAIAYFHEFVEPTSATATQIPPINTRGPRRSRSASRGRRRHQAPC